MYHIIHEEGTNKIIMYVPTTYKLVAIETERPKPPENPKPGINYVEYYNPETGKIELREEERPLTLEERIAEAEKKADASMEAIAEVYENGN